MHQAKSERLPLLEEERDFLLKEKDNLVGRLGGLEARQRLLHEREQQAGYRGNSVAEGMCRTRVFARFSCKITLDAPLATRLLYGASSALYCVLSCWTIFEPC